MAGKSNFCGKKNCKGAHGAPSSPDEYIEGILCQEQDLKENEMKTFKLQNSDVLLVKQKGKIHALGPICTHYGAPLVEGALGDGRIRCKLHGACFNLATGDIEDFPGLDSLPCHKVTIENGNVKVRAKKAELLNNKRIKAMAKKDPGNGKKFVVIGGGPAGAAAVETLRQEGFTGEIAFILQENRLPYDRVKITKDMSFDINQAQYRDEKFYKDNGIDIYKGIAAVAVNTTKKTVSLSNQTEIQYDKLFIGTGSIPRKLDCPGITAKNIFYFRQYEDAAAVSPKLTKETEVVVIGSSFISMETVNTLIDKVKGLTVISRSHLPFEGIWGDTIGGVILKHFQDKGVKYLYNSIKTVNVNEQGAVSGVELTDDDTILKCDLLVIGIGCTAATDFLEGSGIALRPNGFIEVNEFLQTNIPDVYAGGDIAYAPVWSNHNEKSAIGHYGLAHYHGHSAAINMLGKSIPMKAVPYFWTVLLGKSFRYVGHHGQFDDIIYAGDLNQLKFMAFFLQEGEVIAALSCGMDPLVSKFAELLAQGIKLKKEDLKDDPLAWSK